MLPLELLVGGFYAPFKISSAMVSSVRSVCLRTAVALSNPTAIIEGPRTSSEWSHLRQIRISKLASTNGSPQEPYPLLVVIIINELRA